MNSVKLLDILKQFCYPILMKIKDINKGKAKDCETVGDILDFLKNIPRNTPIKAHAEVDACQEEGYPFISLSAGIANPDEAPDTDIADQDVEVINFDIDH